MNINIFEILTSLLILFAWIPSGDTSQRDPWAFEKNTESHTAFKRDTWQLESRSIKQYSSSCTFVRPVQEYNCLNGDRIYPPNFEYFSNKDAQIGVGQEVDGNVVYKFEEFGLAENLTTLTGPAWQTSLLIASDVDGSDTRLRDGPGGCVNLDARVIAFPRTDLGLDNWYHLRSGSERWTSGSDFQNSATVRLLKLNCVRNEAGGVPYAEVYWALCSDPSCQKKQALIINGESTDRYAFYFRYNNEQPPRKFQKSDLGKECYGPHDPIPSCGLIF